MSAAHVRNFTGYLVSGYVEDLLIRIGKVCADVVILDIGPGRTEGMYTRRTTRVVLTSQVDVPVSVNRLEPDVSQRIVCQGTEEIVVPLLGVCVYEDGVRGKAIVEVDDVGKIGRRFSTAQSGRDEQTRLGGFLGGVNEGCATTNSRLDPLNPARTKATRLSWQ